MSESETESPPEARPAAPPALAGYRVLVAFDERWAVGSLIPPGVLDYSAIQKLMFEHDAIAAEYAADH